ncbi:hypothetical protein FIBSPDRAFT_866233 [Athelia psychrophila]|uniref:Phosphatase 2A Regulatory Subunit A helical domain-containing protein n=1 Tax=Athelia psychrophila TaxID=1759441 RepID=A0A166EX00_9AGAM|nr:hypothetical protein FIBSPDRAFT_866233 [Fibularhizoctonia sp. CBS 109695]
MIQALSDVEETVVSKVLAVLTSLCELGLFQKMRIWELMSATLEFLYHLDISFASRDGTSRTDATLIAHLGIAFRRDNGAGGVSGPHILHLLFGRRQDRQSMGYCAAGAGSQGFPIERSHTSSPSPSGQDTTLSTSSLTILAIIVGTELGGHQSGRRTEASEFASEGDLQSPAFWKGFMINGSED